LSARIGRTSLLNVSWGALPGRVAGAEAAELAGRGAGDGGVAETAATTTPSGQGAPASIQRRRVSICAAGSGSAPNGIRLAGSFTTSRW
jgi:hypothetical protein